jgi:hypothetical protein
MWFAPVHDSMPNTLSLFQKHKDHLFLTQNFQSLQSQMEFGPEIAFRKDQARDIVQHPCHLGTKHHKSRSQTPLLSKSIDLETIPSFTKIHLKDPGTAEDPPSSPNLVAQH